MNNSRRMRRMARSRRKPMKMDITSLMDVFTILVFFLLMNSANTEVLEPPKGITLPASVVEEKPRETVVIFVSPDVVTVQGETVAQTADIISTPDSTIAPIAKRLAEIRNNIIGLNTQKTAESQEVTLLADKSVPFSVVKKVMSTSTGEGYGRISLAVLQKASQTPKFEQ
jgi:biopolymer transport protein ExbD